MANKPGGAGNAGLVFGDLHEPWASARAKQQALEATKHLNLQWVLQIGDGADLYNYSKYPTNPDIITPQRETTKARGGLEAFWAKVRQYHPKAKCYMLRGNHDARVGKRVSEVMPALKHLVGPAIEAFFTFEGVTTLHDQAQELFLPNPSGGQRICAIHGHYSRPGQHMDFNDMPTIVGHSHVGGVVFARRRGRTIWELNAGFLGDLSAPVFRYRNQRQICRWTVGYGLVDEHGPRFVPVRG